MNILRILPPPLCLCLALAAAGCGLGTLGESGEDVDERFYGYFLRDAKAMQDMGLPVYWLGREFTPTPAGLTFEGPSGVGIGGEVEGGGVFMRYLPGGPDPGLEITVYSPGAWELRKDRILNPRLMSNEGEVTRQTVIVKGRQAELVSVPSANRPVNALSLILELDAVVVVAGAASGGKGPDGTDYSLFIKNPNLLVQVIDEYLRPYPE